jgi:AraC family transcriptional regulator
MPGVVSSLDAYKYLRATMTACSWKAGWRSVLLRAYTDPPVVEEFTTAATADQLIVLVTSGSCSIEGRYAGRWESACYEAGDIGMTAPGQSTALRWRSETPHSTLHLHVPARTLRQMYRELAPGDPERFQMPSVLCKRDPFIEQVIRGLGEAMTQGIPDVYAETVGDLLAAHLLTRHAHLPAPRRIGRDAARLRRADDYLSENFASEISLEEIARHVGVSRFHVVRLFKQEYGETPFQRLTRLRMEEAKRRLTSTSDPVIEIAMDCGYQNPGNFASAFRRVVGVTPRAYRRSTR